MSASNNKELFPSGPKSSVKNNAGNDPLEEVKSRASIVEIIGQSIALKKQGKNFIGLCPFHGEKTPSFSVSAEKNLFYCFGCHASGDIFTFVMRQEGIGFRQALEKLASFYQVKMAPKSKKNQALEKKKDALVSSNEFAQEVFSKTLRLVAKKYPHIQGLHDAQQVLNKRRISWDVVKDWGIGFGGQSEDFGKALAKKKLDLKPFMDHGLIGDNGKSLFFSSRITIPIYNEYSKLIGFGGRKILEHHQAKYLNSRENLSFQKKEVFFGLNKARKEILKAKSAVVVEGFFDVIACHLSGETKAVATLGTALSDSHIQKLKKYAGEITLLYDSDKAGLRAAYSSAVKMLKAELKVNICQLPKGEDPASLWEKHQPSVLLNALKTKTHPVEFFLEQKLQGIALRGNADHLSIQEKVAGVEFMGPLIKALPSGLEQELYVSQLSGWLGLGQEQLNKTIDAADEVFWASAIKAAKKLEKKIQSEKNAQALELSKRATVDGPTQDSGYSSYASYDEGYGQYLSQSGQIDGAEQAEYLQNGLSENGRTLSEGTKAPGPSRESFHPTKVEFSILQFLFRYPESVIEFSQKSEYARPIFSRFLEKFSQALKDEAFLGENAGPDDQPELGKDYKDKEILFKEVFTKISHLFRLDGKISYALNHIEAFSVDDFEESFHYDRDKKKTLEDSEKKLEIVYLDSVIQNKLVQLKENESGVDSESLSYEEGQKEESQSKEDSGSKENINRLLKELNLLKAKRAKLKQAEKKAKKEGLRKRG